MTAEEKILTARFETDGADRIDGYTAAGGYRALRAAFERSPDEIVETVKVAGLRGRGGAGFPTGAKWGFVPHDAGPVHLVCNADEGEPGTFKDRELIERDPHQLVEALLVSAYALRANRVWVYLRGEFLWAGRQLERAIEEARANGFVGRDILGSGFDCEIAIFRGAGAYICGEETALLESMEGRRGQPRLRPPFPAQQGLYGEPTVVNNVETLACIPHIVEKGAEWFRGIGTEKSPGTKIFSLSGDVVRPGNYEVPFGTPARALIEDLAGGVPGGKALKAFTPGGSSSTPIFGADKTDVHMDWESVGEAGSMLGTGAIMVFAEDACMVRYALRFNKFYEHESCGKCTPCREGTFWMTGILQRIEDGSGREEDLDLLTDVCGNILGRSFCALGDFAAAPPASTIKEFRDEYLQHIKNKGCPFER